MTYHFTGPDEDQSFETISEAMQAAQALATADHTEVSVFHTETGATAGVATWVSPGNYFPPFERVETPKHAAPAYHGFVTAYVRKRIEATVYRGREENDKKGQWLIHDGRSGGHVIVASTKQANEVTKEMRHGRIL